MVVVVGGSVKSECCYGDAINETHICANYNAVLHILNNLLIYALVAPLLYTHTHTHIKYIIPVPARYLFFIKHTDTHTFTHTHTHGHTCIHTRPTPTHIHTP